MGRIHALLLLALALVATAGCRHKSSSTGKGASDDAAGDNVPAVDRDQAAKDIEALLTLAAQGLVGEGGRERLSKMYKTVYGNDDELSPVALVANGCVATDYPLGFWTSSVRSGQTTCARDPKFKAALAGAASESELLDVSLKEFTRNLYLWTDPKAARSDTLQETFLVSKTLSDPDAATEVARLRTKALAKIPVARAFLIPTVHFGEDKDDGIVCLSNTLLIRPVATSARLQVSGAVEAEEGTQEGDLRAVRATQTLVTTSEAAPDELKKTMHLDYLAGLFKSPHQAHTHLAFARLHPASATDAPEDLKYTCADEPCVVLRGKDVKSADDCPVYSIAP